MMLLMANFVVIGTWNTKGDELEFVCRELTKRNHNPIKLDLSARKTTKDRDTALLSIVDAARKRLATLAKKEHISGALSIGGGTNLWMSGQIMSEIPLMVPKVIVSTMIANSLTALRTYKDITYVQAPCDFAWRNPLSEMILKNCVALLTSMEEGVPRLDKPAIAITNFGITSGFLPGAKAFWDKKGYHLIPFHAIGESTMAMAELAEKGFFKGMLDLTLHDILDHVANGSCGKLDERRLYSYLSRDLPAVMAPGGLDFIAYVPENGRLPRAFANRKIYRHDYRVGVRASVKEVVKAAKWLGPIVEKARPEHALLLLPLGGWSGPGVRGSLFYDAELNEAFTEEMLKYWSPACVIDVDLPLEDPRFAKLASEYLFGLMQKKWKM
jgi:uncharacterized protein (UPF0261 family)